MDIQKNFGLIIKKWRNKAGLSQEALAAGSNLHRTYISDIERGTRNVSLINVQKLADALNISLAVIFADVCAEPAKTSKKMTTKRVIP